MTGIERRDVLKAGAAGGALAFAPAGIARGATAAAPSPRRATLLDDGWRFHLGHAADMARDFGFGRNQRTYAKAGAQTADAAMAAFDDGGWAKVRVPHDWAVDLPYAPPDPPAPADAADAVAAHGYKAIGRDHPENSIGWYRRALDIKPDDKDRAVWLEFDGVFRDCIVFVNGYVAGANQSGYVPFRVEIGDFLDYAGGPNVLTVRADATLGEGWFYEGAGIYRHVRLVSAARVHVRQWGVFVRAGPDRDGASVRVTIDVVNGTLAPTRAIVSHRIVAPDGSVAASLDDTPVALAAAQKTAVESAGRVRAPQLWSVETPSLYRLVTEIRVDGELADRVETPFGIRAIAFDAQRGFFLNGKSVKLLGTCNHQDHAGVGTAIPDRLHAWRVAQLQAMGSNAWRSAHNPPAQALLDICDATGMLMIVEARRNSTDPESLDELDRIVRSSRNHPCVILWSIGNEERHQGTGRGAHISAELVAAVKALDPTRPTTQAFDNSFGEGATRVVDVIGFNYRTEKIEAFHAAHPDQPIIGTETGSTVATRGEYADDPARHIVRAYDTEHPWWASTAEEWWKIAADRRYIAGGFVWTGFDYRGEPTPYPAWPSVSSYFGLLDLCGFPKDNYWYYRIWWRPDVPALHLFPHWTWPGREGQPVKVWVYANCEEVELLVNGRAAGRQRVVRNGHLAWTVPYAPGLIEAIGYSDGRRVLSQRSETTGAPASLRLTPDRAWIAGDGRDLALVTVEVLDAAGRIVPDAAPTVRLTTTGPGRLIGAGNGDPTCHAGGHDREWPAFHGMLQAIVQSGHGAGVIGLSAAADGLPTVMLPIGVAAA